MFISYVFRLRPEASHRGSFTAEIEAIGSGRRTIVHSTEEFMDFVNETTEAEMALHQRSRPRREP